MFRQASTYHAALGIFFRAFSRGQDLEAATQDVLGATLRYRRALERCLLEVPESAVAARRAAAVKELLHLASAAYNSSRRRRRLRNVANGRATITSAETGRYRDGMRLASASAMQPLVNVRTEHAAPFTFRAVMLAGALALAIVSSDVFGRPMADEVPQALDASLTPGAARTQREPASVGATRN